MPLTEYTSIDIEKYKFKLLDTGVSKVTVNIRYRSVNTLFNFAIKHNIIENTPFRATRQFKIPKQSPQFLTIEQFNKLLNIVVEDNLRDIFTFAVLTGMRLNEISNLRWESIEWKSNIIHILNTEEFVTKNSKERTVPMHQVVVEMLQRRYKRFGNSKWVFCKSTLYKYSGSYISHKFRHYCEVMGYPKKYHFHTLRHTFASWLVAQNVNIYTVMELLGHSNVTTTQIYAHLQKSQLQNSVNQLKLLEE